MPTMKSYTLLIFLLVVQGCQPVRERSFSDADEVRIHNLLEDQVEAWNLFDIDAFMEGYWNSDSLQFVSGNGIRRGWTDTKNRYKQTYSTPELMGRLRFEILFLRPLGSDHCLVTGRYLLERKEDSPSGIFTLVFLRTEDGWRIMYDHTSG